MHLSNCLQKFIIIYRTKIIVCVIPIWQGSGCTWITQSQNFLHVQHYLTCECCTYGKCGDVFSDNRLEVGEFPIGWAEIQTPKKHTIEKYYILMEKSKCLTVCRRKKETDRSRNKRTNILRSEKYIIKNDRLLQRAGL